MQNGEKVKYDKDSNASVPEIRFWGRLNEYFLEDDYIFSRRMLFFFFVVFVVVVSCGGGVLLFSDHNKYSVEMELIFF